MSLTADHILRLLHTKHAEDVFVPECKDGPSWNGNHFRLDAWVMNKSWSNPCVTGYEIKVSRSDFTKDNKWTAYLSMCNVLFFVCPTGLIKPEELPGDVGLYWVASTGTRLIQKKKAAFRQVVIPETLYRYILMCRVKIQRDCNYTETREDKLKYWQNWLEEKAEAKDLGYKVSREIRERANKIFFENEKLRKENQALAEVKAFCQKINFSIHYGGTWGLEDKIRELTAIIPKELTSALENLERTLRETRKVFKDLEEKKEFIP